MCKRSPYWQREVGRRMSGPCLCALHRPAPGSTGSDALGAPCTSCGRYSHRQRAMHASRSLSGDQWIRGTYSYRAAAHMFLQSSARILLDHLDPNHIFVRETLLAALPEKNTEELSKGRRHVTARDHCARGELFPSRRPAVACHLRPRSTAGRARSTCTRLSVAVDASKSKLPTEPTA